MNHIKEDEFDEDAECEAVRKQLLAIAETKGLDAAINAAATSIVALERSARQGFHLADEMARLLKQEGD